MTSSRGRLRSLVTWLGLSVALAVALVIPAGYFAIVYSQFDRELSFAANLKASRLARFIYANRELWQYQTLRLGHLIEVPEADESTMRQRIFDADGRLLFESGAAPAAPVTTFSAPLVVAGATVGSIETAASLRNLLAETVLVGLLSGILGFSTFFILRVVPLRVIDRTLAELENMQTRYRRLFDASPFPTFVIDRETLRVLDANETVVRQYGWPRAELLSMAANDFYPPEDLPAIVAERRRFTMDASHAVPQLRHRKKDGSVIEVEQIVYPIEFAGRSAYLVTVNDVTERNRVMKELLASEQKYHAMIETLPVGVIETTAQSRIVMANAAWRRLFGFSDTEDLGEVDVRTLYADPRDRGAVLMALEGGAAQPPSESMFRRRDGSLFPVERHLREVRDGDGRIIGVRGIVIDITHRKLLEAQLHQAHRMEAVGKLTGGIAHDFNNILMMMMASVDALEEDEGLAPPARRRVAQIGKAIGRAADLTRSLLAFSRKLPLKPQRVDLNALVVDIGRLLRRTLGSQVEIESTLADDLWPVEIDRGQFENALINLCLNARDAMPEGGRLRIETANVELRDGPEAAIPPGAYVRLAVVDTGTGIPPETLPRVFDPFFTTKEVGKGTGLGLSMVHGFISQSRGHIDIRSELGRGTSVAIHLPRALGPPIRESLPEPAIPPRGSERILVVDDEDRVGDAVVEQMRGLGYAVTRVADGAAGLAAVKGAERPYDLLLTDVVMPGIGGRKLADEVAALSPATAVLFMSGYSRDDIIQDGRIDPGARLLTKPFHKGDLARAVRDALDGAPRSPPDTTP
ncbi:MAG: PAS domain S-box protein [Rhodospirillales bacterium]|nr:PAS domain S-box protein [Rhodospirillales bacterium]